MDFEDSLAAAGLAVQKECGDLGPLLPAVVAGQAPSCPLEERGAELTLTLGDPLAQDSANSAWYRIAIESGLFTDTDRRFLLAQDVGNDGPSQWICVELQGSWDIMGEGAAGPLGSAYFRPEFRMLSLDGSVLCCGTTGESAISIFALTKPGRSATFRRFAEWMATTEDLHPTDAAALHRWFESIRSNES